MLRRKDGWSENYEAMALISILVFGLILRLWNIGFELPNLYTGFEQNEVLRAVRLGMGEFDFGRMLKGGYFYFLFLEYCFFFLVLRVFGIVQSPNEFAMFFIEDHSSFFLIGRVTTAIIGALSILLVYFLGKKMFGKRVGLMAALFFGLNPIHIKYSHYVNVDITMVAFAIGSMYAIVLLMENGHLKYYLLAGFLIALAAMNKLPGILLILPFLVAHALRVREENGHWGKWVDRRLLYALSLLVIVYVVGNPAVLVEFQRFQNLVLKISFIDPVRVETGIKVFSGETPNLWFYYLEKLFMALGPSLFLIVLLGFLRSFWRPSKGEIILLIFCLSFFTLISLSSFSQWRDRYILPIIPFGLILGAKIIDEVTILLSRRGYSTRAILGTLVLITCLPAGYLGVVKAGEFSRPDTRSLAKEWVEEYVPSGTRILLEGNPIAASKLTVQIENITENLLVLAEEVKESNPGKATFIKMKAGVKKEKAFDLVAVESPRTPWKPLDEYKKIGVEYIILNVRSFTGKKSVKYTDQVHENRRSFYQQIQEDSGISLVKRFDPFDSDAKGPIIDIYKVIK